jgi:hypothetical protein
MFIEALDIKWDLGTCPPPPKGKESIFKMPEIAF